MYPSGVSSSLSWKYDFGGVTPQESLESTMRMEGRSSSGGTCTCICTSKGRLLLRTLDLLGWFSSLVLGFMDNDSKENSQTVPPRRCLDPFVLADASEKDLVKSRAPLGSTGDAILMGDCGMGGEGKGGSAVDPMVEWVIWLLCLVPPMVCRRVGATGGLLPDRGDKPLVWEWVRRIPLIRFDMDTGVLLDRWVSCVVWVSGMTSLSCCCLGVFQAALLEMLSKDDTDWASALFALFRSTTTLGVTSGTSKCVPSMLVPSILDAFLWWRLLLGGF